MHWDPEDSWAVVQRLVGCIHAEMWGASLGQGAGGHCETQQPEAQSYKLLMTLVVVELLSLQQG